MQADIHPSYKEIQVSCSCGNQFNIKSTAESDSLHIDVCDKCHPFYTGKQKVIDTAGRINKFKEKFAGISAKKSTTDKS